MGTWGYRLIQDDLFNETKENFAKMQHSGMPFQEIEKELADKDCPEGQHLVKMAFAECLWENGVLDQQHLDGIKRIIEQKTDLTYFLGLGADSEFLSHREQELIRFYKKLQTPSPKKPCMQFPNRLLQKGDVFWYRSSGVVYGAVVAEIQGDYSLIALSTAIAVSANVSQVLAAKLYTAAWFFPESMLPPQRIHKIATVSILHSLQNKMGLEIEENHSVCCKNVGQSATWQHRFRQYTRAGTIGELLNISKTEQ